jgi:hypothetical protein
VPRFAPDAAQMLLLAKIAQHIAVRVEDLATSDIETNLSTSIDLITLAKEGLVRYSIGDRHVRCTPTGRLWLIARGRMPRLVEGQR